MVFSPTLQMTPQQQVQKSQVPDYLQQDPSNTSAAGAVNNMVRALMSGDANFKARQAANATSMNPTTTTGGPSVGAPLSLAPPAPGAGMSPPPQMPPPMSITPPQPQPQPSPAMAPPVPMPTPRPAFDAGAAPMPMDPTTPGINPMMAGLFGQIPGAGGG